MSRLTTVLAVVGAAMLMSTPLLAADQSTTEESREKTVQLSEVPTPAVNAAKQTIGGNVNEAKVTVENGQQVYELQGKDASGKTKSVHVTADGKVLKTESGKESD